MSQTTPQPRKPKLAFRTLHVGGFEIKVTHLEHSGIWSRRERAFIGIKGTGYVTLPCLAGTDDAEGVDFVFRPRLEVVAEVRWPETQINLAEARMLRPEVQLGQSIEVPVVLDEEALSQQLSVVARDIGLIGGIAAKGRVFVAFDDISVRRVMGRSDAGEVVAGTAIYPAVPHAPKRLEVEVGGFTLHFKRLVLDPKSATADAVLSLPETLGDPVTCRPATLDLGSVRLGPECTISVERRSQDWGPWIVGDTGLVAEGRGFVFDPTRRWSVPGHVPMWRGLRLFRGHASGADTIPDPCNSGWLGGTFDLDDAVIKPSGLSGTLRLRAPHRYHTLNPLNYKVVLEAARLDLTGSRIDGGTLGPGRITFPKKAVQQPGGGDVSVGFTTLGLQPNLDVAGQLADGAALAWGGLAHPGDELEVQEVAAGDGLVFLPAGARASFRPMRPTGFMKLSGSLTSAQGLVLLALEDASGVTFQKLGQFKIHSPDRPGRLPLAFDLARGWLRVDTLGVDAEVVVTTHLVHDPFGEPARHGYLSSKSFETTFSLDERCRLAGQWVSSANSRSDFSGRVKLLGAVSQPSPNENEPRETPDLPFTALQLTSTGELVGGTVGLPPEGVKLDRWQVDLVPTGKEPDEAGVLSIRTGRIVFTAAGIGEPVHFGKPFYLTWGEILADGNLGELLFDVGAQGQTFDGLPYAPSHIALLPHGPDTPGPFLSTCGTVHFGFFGPAPVNIRDARDDAKEGAPFFKRHVTVPDTGDATCVPTDLHLAGTWKNSAGANLVALDFPHATMGYNVDLQDGFIGTGTGTMSVLSGGPLDATIEARRDGIDIHLSSLEIRDINLGLYAPLGGMTEIKSCIRIEGPLLRRMNLGGMLERTVSPGSGILAPKGGHVVEVNMTVTPNSLDLFASGSILMQVAAAAVDLYAQLHVQHDYLRNTAEGEVLGRIDCNSVLGGLEGDGQVTWFVGPESGHMQGNLRVCMTGSPVMGAMEGGFFVGHQTPRDLAWVLQPGSSRFGVSLAILPETLSGVFGYGQLAMSSNVYLFSGGVELYAALGAFDCPPGSSGWQGYVLPYVVGSGGVHLHGKILGGVVSASGWAALNLRGPLPIYYEGRLGLRGCAGWVFCKSVDLTVGLCSGGFYVK